jgi:hypothetical protein
MHDRYTIVRTTTEVLHADFKAKKLSLEDFMTAAYIISEVKEPEDLMQALLIFKDQFQSFADALLILESQEREEFEYLLKLAIPKILLERPELANQILEFAQDKKVDMDDLEKQFPEALMYFREAQNAKKKQGDQE